MKLGAVVLAAGGSSRFGSPKQLLQLNGEPLVKRAARVAMEAGTSPVIVVLGADHQAIAQVLADLSAITVVVNHEWRTGLASSFTLGLRALMDLGDCDGAVVTLADQPSVDAGALKRLISAFDAGHRLVASSYQGTIGVPAVFGRECLPDLLQLSGDAGAGAWLRKRWREVTAVPLESESLDIDTPADAKQLQ